MKTMLYNPSVDQFAVEASKPPLIVTTCHRCHKTWTRPSPNQYSGDYTGACSACGRLDRIESFEKQCPPLYLKTDPARLPKLQLDATLAWKPGARGLILVGETGRGKTRAAWLLIRQLMANGAFVEILCFDAVGFGHDLSRHYKSEDAEDWLDSVANAPMVFFDDLGKLKLTERAEAEIFGVIERRFSRELPVLVTTNDTGDTLASRMTDGRGPALIRRLREFCEVIQF